jgi:hypothetical protein
MLEYVASVGMEIDIAHYACRRVRQPIRIDGDLDKPVWKNAAWSPRFVDLVTGRPGFFNTQAAALWDDEAFYVAFRAETPFVEAALTERDSLVWGENDLEVFIDGGDCYYEFEINALGTLYEIFFIWQDAYKRGGRFDTPEFDLLGRKVLSYGGDYDRIPASFWNGTHPRGNRWAFLDWDFPKLRSAVRIDGKINDDSVIDKGWTAEVAFPWAGMKSLANGRSLPPKDGDAWRMFFGRYEKLNSCGVEVQPHPAWCWNRHGVNDSHFPECWTYVDFSAEVNPE